MKDFFSKNTVEIIKHEMTKALYLGEGHDEVWIVESDKMKDYKNYFKADNSSNLIDKFCLSKRADRIVSEKSFIFSQGKIQSDVLLESQTKKS